MVRLLFMEVVSHMEIMTNHIHNMTFYLKISFENVEVKGPSINLKKFLYLNDKISVEIKDLCLYKSYVNFAETILNGLEIKGEIQTVFNHKRFISSLKEFQLNHKSSWEGYFSYRDNKDYFIFRAPKFKKEVL